LGKELKSLKALGIIPPSPPFRKGGGRGIWTRLTYKN
jgi:hypothetical protein